MSERLLKVTYREAGPPERVLAVEEAERAPLGPGQVRLRLLAAAINPSDLGMIAGTYGRQKELPAVAGLEGAAEVVEVGDGVEHLVVGHWVRMPNVGVWQTEAVAPAAELFSLPAGLDPLQAACGFVNPPTAYRLLKDYVSPEPGTWLVQNAANSAVGVAVIQLARHFGMKTINLVRRPELVEPLQEMGADVVLLESDDAWPKRVPELTGGAPLRLALNSVGGESVSRQIKALSRGGVCVTFGGMVGDPIRFPTRFLIFNDVRLVGFWLDRYNREIDREELRSFYGEVFELIRQGVLSTKIQATYPLEQVKKAIAHSQQPRLGKIVLVPE